MAERPGETQTVVTHLNLPRALPNLQTITWERLCEAWQMRVLGNAGALMFAVELPAGWHLLPLAVGSQWSRLLDPRGRERATLFVHPGWSDQCASLYVRCRYSLHYHYDVPGDPSLCVIAARDDQRIFKEFGRVATRDPAATGAIESLHVAGCRWLDGALPQWRDPFAYWEDAP